MCGKAKARPMACLGRQAGRHASGGGRGRRKAVQQAAGRQAEQGEVVCLPVR